MALRKEEERRSEPLWSAASLYRAMYPVTHMVVAVGGVWAGERLSRRLPGVRGDDGAATGIDYRFVALGALMPDVIDKPLYRVTSIGSDHAIGHTLAFSLALIAVGAVLARRGEMRLFWLGLGSLSHPLVDPVVMYPGTLLWPLLGWGFEPSPGIPGLYLRAADAALAAVALGLWWKRGWFRARVRRFARVGAV